jgi:hypothetical protein
MYTFTNSAKNGPNHSKQNMVVLDLIQGTRSDSLIWNWLWSESGIPEKPYFAYKPVNSSMGSESIQSGPLPVDSYGDFTYNKHVSSVIRSIFLELLILTRYYRSYRYAKPYTIISKKYLNLLTLPKMDQIAPNNFLLYIIWFIDHVPVVRFTIDRDLRPLFTKNHTFST